MIDGRNIHLDAGRTGQMYPPSIVRALCAQCDYLASGRTRNPYFAILYCMALGNQLNPHFFAQQMGRSHAPYPRRPHHGHPPQNQRIPLLCVMDHSSGHTEEWVSSTPTPGATPKRGKTLPGALTYSLKGPPSNQTKEGAPTPRVHHRRWWTRNVVNGLSQFRRCPWDISRVCCNCPG